MHTIIHSRYIDANVETSFIPFVSISLVESPHSIDFAPEGLILDSIGGSD